MHLLFSVPGARHGQRSPLLAFSPAEDLLAVGSGTTCTIYGKEEAPVGTVSTDGAPILDLAWSADGAQLAVLCHNSSTVHLWIARSRKTTKLKLDVTGPVCAAWSADETILVVGTSQGHTFAYNSRTGVKTPSIGLHNRAVTALCFGLSDSNLCTLSGDALIVSDRKGNTLASLRQKSLGGMFLNKILPVSVLCPGRASMDAVVIPVYYNHSLDKRAAKGSLLLGEGFRLLVVGVSTAACEEYRDLADAFREEAYGCGAAAIPAGQGEAYPVDLLFLPRSKSTPPAVCCLMSDGAVHVISLDHSRRDPAMRLSEAGDDEDEAHNRGRYLRPIWSRSSGQGQGVGPFAQLVEEYNGTVDPMSGMPDDYRAKAQLLKRSACSCQAMRFLTLEYGTNNLLVPMDKTFNVVDVVGAQPLESPFIDFTGKMSGVAPVMSYPSNIIYADSSSTMLAVAFANGTLAVFLCKSVRMSARSLQVDAIGLEYAGPEEFELYSLDGEDGAWGQGGQPGSPRAAGLASSAGPSGAPAPSGPPRPHNCVFFFSLSAPKIAGLQWAQPAQYSAPQFSRAAGSIQLDHEPTQLAVSENACGYVHKTSVTWSPIALDEGGSLLLAWTTCKVRSPVADLALVTPALSAELAGEPGAAEGGAGERRSLAGAAGPADLSDPSDPSDPAARRPRRGAQPSPCAVARTEEGEVQVMKDPDCVLVVGAGAERSGGERAGGAKAQAVACCSPYLFALTTKGDLLSLYLEEGSSGLTATEVCRTSVSGYEGPSPPRPNAIGAPVIAPNPGGYYLVLYKRGLPSRPAVYLVAEDILLENVFGEEVSVYDVVFDSSLPSTFYCSICGAGAPGGDRAGPESVTLTESRTCTIHPGLADMEGPGVLWVRSTLANLPGTAAPYFVSNGLAYVNDGGDVKPGGQVPGLANAAASISAVDAADVAGQIPEERNICRYVQESNPVLPVGAPAITQLSGGVSADAALPEYRPLPHPSVVASFEKAVEELCALGLTRLAYLLATRVRQTDLLKLVADTSVRMVDFDTARHCYNALSVFYSPLSQQAGVPVPKPAGPEGRAGGPPAARVSERAQPNAVVRSLNLPNSTHNHDPAAISLLLSRICLQEPDLNTSMALAMLLACPDLSDPAAEGFLDAAERMLLKSNRPSLALSFRIDSLDWDTASMLARKISSPVVRSEILLQWAGELEGKGLFSEALEVCTTIVPSGSYDDLRPGSLQWNQIPPHALPLLIGTMARCYCQLGKVSDVRNLALPLHRDGRYIPRPKDSLNILQRSRLCMEVAGILSAQKRYADAGAFYEASAHLAYICYGRLAKELKSLLTGELSLVDAVSEKVNLVLFALLPQVRARAAAALASLDTSGNSDTLDISLLRMIDVTLNLDRTREVLQRALPQRLSDVVSPADMLELNHPVLLSKAANCYIKAQRYADAERLVQYINDRNTIADLARVFLRESPEKALVLFKRAGRSREIVDCLIALNKLAEAESAVREVKRQLDRLGAGAGASAAAGAGGEPGDVDGPEGDAGAGAGGAEGPSSPAPGGAARPQAANAAELASELQYSATALAKYYHRTNNAKKAVYYYLLASEYDQAIELANASGNEDLLVRFVDKRAPLEVLRRLARHFASQDPEVTDRKAPRNAAAAAKFLRLANTPEAAIKMLLVYGNQESDIDSALEMLQEAPTMLDFVIRFLKGAMDGKKRSPIYFFKMYMALGRYSEAARTAYFLADQEMARGMFGRAKNLLLQSMLKIWRQTGHVPAKFRDLLVVLHGVEAGRYFAQHGLHAQAGVCLYRASRVASRFGPEHGASILLSACVECSRTNELMMRQAYECAGALLKDYPEHIPEKYQQAVEKVVRRYRRQPRSAEGAGAPAEATTPCCSCGEPVKASDLKCGACYAILPLDVVSGSHMTISDFCECPHCSWGCSKLGFYEVFSSAQVDEGQAHCLMCGRRIDVANYLVADESNFEALASGTFDYEGYELRPLIVYEDGKLASRRYEAWNRMWSEEGA